MKGRQQFRQAGVKKGKITYTLLLVESFPSIFYINGFKENVNKASIVLKTNWQEQLFRSRFCSKPVAPTQHSGAALTYADMVKEKQQVLTSKDEVSVKAELRQQAHDQTKSDMVKETQYVLTAKEEASAKAEVKQQVHDQTKSARSGDKKMVKTSNHVNEKRTKKRGKDAKVESIVSEGNLASCMSKKVSMSRATATAKANKKSLKAPRTKEEVSAKISPEEQKGSKVFSASKEGKAVAKSRHRESDETSRGTKPNQINRYGSTSVGEFNHKRTSSTLTEENSSKDGSSDHYICPDNISVEDCQELANTCSPVKRTASSKVELNQQEDCEARRVAAVCSQEKRSHTVNSTLSCSDRQTVQREGTQDRVAYAKEGGTTFEAKTTCKRIPSDNKVPAPRRSVQMNPHLRDRCIQRKLAPMFMNNRAKGSERYTIVTLFK